MIPVGVPETIRLVEPTVTEVKLNVLVMVVLVEPPLLVYLELLDVVDLLALLELLVGAVPVELPVLAYRELLVLLELLALLVVAVVRVEVGTPVVVAVVDPPVTKELELDHTDDIEVDTSVVVVLVMRVVLAVSHIFQPPVLLNAEGICPGVGFIQS